MYHTGSDVPDEEFSRKLDVGWDRERLHAAAASLAPSELVEQAASEQRPHKISFEVHSADADALLARLRRALDATGAYSLVFSAGKDVDILPRGASKGEALRVLLGELAHGVRGGGQQQGSDVLKQLAERTLVCGDSGNDVELVAVDDVRACVVANAKQELLKWCVGQLHARFVVTNILVHHAPAIALRRVDEHRSARIYQAKGKCADGVVEAMIHFGFVLILD